MRKQINLLKYIKKHYLVTNEEWLVSVFWNSIILGFFLLPLWSNFSTPIFISSILFGVCNVFRFNKINYTGVVKNWVLLCFPIMIILMLLSLIYTYNIDYGIEIIGRSIPLLFFPILFIFISVNRGVVSKLFYAIVTGVLLAFFFNLLEAIYNSVQIIGGTIIFDASIAGGYSFFESFKHGGSHFIASEFSKNVHPSYMSLYVLFCLVFLVKNIRKNSRNIYIIVLLLIYLYLLASRASIFVFLLFVLIMLYKVRLKKMWFISAGTIIVVGMIIFLNPRMHTLYSGLKSFGDKKNYSYTTSEQSRILTYKSALKLIADSPILGYGVGDANEVLLKEYVNNNYDYNAKYKYNAHNQFFQTLLQTGMFGFIFLCLPFLYLFYWGKSDIYTIGYLLILVAPLFFESMLVRYNGIIF